MTLFVLCLAIAVATAACGIGPLVPVVNVDQDAAERLARDVPTYRANGSEYVAANIGSVEATSCKNKLWDKPASEEDAIAQLRYKAMSAGGNAIANPTCHQEGTDLAKNCWSSVTCNATVLRTDSKSRLEAELEQEFWQASPLTRVEYEEDSHELSSVSQKQWEALRNFNAGVESDEDRFQIKMLSKEQRRGIIEIAKWLTWKDQWIAQKKAELQAEQEKQRQESRDEQALQIQRFEALEAARPRFSDCFPNYLGGVSCAQR